MRYLVVARPAERLKVLECVVSAFVQRLDVVYVLSLSATEFAEGLAEQVHAAGASPVPIVSALWCGFAVLIVLLAVLVAIGCVRRAVALWRVDGFRAAAMAARASGANGHERVHIILFFICQALAFCAQSVRLDCA